MPSDPSVYGHERDGQNQCQKQRLKERPINNVGHVESAGSQQQQSRIGALSLIHPGSCSRRRIDSRLRRGRRQFFRLRTDEFWFSRTHLLPSCSSQSTKNLARRWARSKMTNVFIG